MRAGRNVVAVRIWSSQGEGGFRADPERMRIELPEPIRLYRSDWDYEYFFAGDEPYRFRKW